MSLVGSRYNHSPVYTKTHQVECLRMLSTNHTTNHYHDTATFLKICNDISIMNIIEIVM